MATGALDANGVWIYGEDDPASPVSDLLNLGMDSVSDAVGDAKARLITLESDVHPLAYAATAICDAAGLFTVPLPAGWYASTPTATATCVTTTQNTVTMIETVTTSAVTGRVRFFSAGAWAAAVGFAVAVTVIGVSA